MACNVHPARPDQVRASLRLLLAREMQSPRQLEAQVDAFLSYAAIRDLDLALHLVCEAEGRPVASCLAIPSKGRTAMIMIPSVRVFGRWKEQIVALLRGTVVAARNHNLRLLQALADPDEPWDGRALQEAGFRYLADLLYLERRVKSRFPFPQSPEKDLRWITYSAQTHEIFTATIAKTYQGSLDCIGLNGLRDIEDIVESHKASGIYMPQAWWVVAREDEPVGVILLAQVPHGSALEIVYMGVVPRARGTGIGDGLMRKALQAAGRTSCNTLTLAVDEANAPARAFYVRHGFKEIGKRRAYIVLIDS